MGGHNTESSSAPLSACKILDYLTVCEAKVSNTNRQFLTPKWLADKGCQEGNVVALSAQGDYEKELEKGDRTPSFFQSNAFYISAQNYHRSVKLFDKCMKEGTDKNATKCMEKVQAFENSTRAYTQSNK